MFIFRRLFDPLAGFYFDGANDGGSGGSGGGGNDGGQGGGGGQNGPVPYERFQQVNTELREARSQLEQTQSSMEELRTELAQVRDAQTAQQRQGLSELDRVRAELADAQAAVQTLTNERDTAQTEVTNLTRGQWVRDAAAAAHFHDPTDALARVDLSQIRTADAARREVEAIAERATHLIDQARANPDANGGGSAGDLVQQVLNGGQRVSTDGGQNGGQGNGGQGGNGGPTIIPADKLNAMTQDELVVLQTTQPDVYTASIAAAAQAD